MVRSWQPTSKTATTPDWGSHRLHGSFNHSLNNSFNNDSTFSYPSPRNLKSPQRRSIPDDDKTTNNFLDFDKVPRFDLFETKADIQYLPEDDDIAARAYADRDFIKATPRQERDSHKSGYDFETLLKQESSTKQAKTLPWVGKL